MVFTYPYAKKSGRAFPKEFQNYKFVTQPYMVRFTYSGFSKDYILQEYIEKVVLPYKQKIGKEIVLILDQAGCHTSKQMQGFLDSKQLFYLYIPAGSTHVFQPIDLMVNRPFKAEMRQLYLAWLEASIAKSNVTVLSPPDERLMIDWVYKSMPVITSELILKSFESAGILGSLRNLNLQSSLNEGLSKMIDESLRIGTAQVESEYMDLGDRAIENLISGTEIFLEGETL